jgi:hypothetical protein
MKDATWIRPLTTAWSLVIVGASAAAAQAPNVVGRVTVYGGPPLAGVDVIVDGTKLATRTDANGAFELIGVPAGAQDLLVRGTGYLPARTAIRAPDLTGTLAITVLREPPDLAEQADKKKESVVAGYVVDVMNQPLAGVTLDIVGGRRRTATTDSTGWFAVTGVRTGVVVYRARLDGYFASRGAIRLKDRRGIVVKLEALDVGMGTVRRASASNLNPGDEAAWGDAAQRFTMRGARAVILSSVDLAPFAERTLREALTLTKYSDALSSEILGTGDNICVLANGSRPVGSTSLDSWRARDVDLVELYPPGTETSETALRYLKNAGCVAREGPTGKLRPPFVAVVWLR